MRIFRTTILIFFYCFVGVKLTRDTALNGGDFDVYWRCARALLDGEPLYSLGRDGIGSFKYPPWFIPFFLPLAWMPLIPAKTIWGVINFASLLVIVRWMTRFLKISLAFSSITLLIMGGIFASHSIYGQVLIPWLAALLPLYSAHLRAPHSPFALAGAFILAPVKIFTGLIWVPFLLSLRQKADSLRTFLKSAFTPALLALCIGAVFSAPVWLLSQRESGLDPLWAWFSTMTTSSNAFGPQYIYSTYNQGLPAALIRIFGLQSSGPHWDAPLAVVSAIILGVFWHRVSKSLSKEEGFCGWLALIPVIHPLCWWHTFVLAFPLLALVLQKTFDSRRHRSLSILACLLTGWITENTTGAFGAGLLFFSSKSLGVLLGIYTLGLLNRSTPIAVRSSRTLD